MEQCCPPVPVSSACDYDAKKSVSECSRGTSKSALTTFCPRSWPRNRGPGPSVDAWANYARPLHTHTHTRTHAATLNCKPSRYGLIHRARIAFRFWRIINWNRWLGQADNRADSIIEHQWEIRFERIFRASLRENIRWIVNRETTQFSVNFDVCRILNVKTF